MTRGSSFGSVTSASHSDAVTQCCEPRPCRAGSLGENQRDTVDVCGAGAVVAACRVQTDESRPDHRWRRELKIPGSKRARPSVECGVWSVDGTVSTTGTTGTYRGALTRSAVTGALRYLSRRAGGAGEAAGENNGRGRRAGREFGKERGSFAQKSRTERNEGAGGLCERHPVRYKRRGSGEA